MNARFAILIAVPALLVGALLGHFVPSLLSRAPEPAEGEKTSEKRSARTRTQPSREHDADLNRLRARIKELERQLADATGTAAESEDETPVKPEERPQNPFLRDGPPRMPTAAEMRANLEELREKDPAKYAQMTNRFARMQEHRLQRTNNRLEILDSVDTSRLNEKELQTHEALREAIVKREELRQLLNEDVTEEQRRATFEELSKLNETMRQLETRERNTLLTKTARSFGVSAANAKELTETIKAIYEATSGGGHHGPPPGRPGGPRGGWGRR